MLAFSIKPYTCWLVSASWNLIDNAVYPIHCLFFLWDRESWQKTWNLTFYIFRENAASRFDCEQLQLQIPYYLQLISNQLHLSFPIVLYSFYCITIYQLLFLSLEIIKGLCDDFWGVGPPPKKKDFVSCQFTKPGTNYEQITII